MRRATFSLVLILWASAALAACSRPQAKPAAIPTPSIDAPGVLSEEQAATLGSLELVDEHPLYTMRYVGAYSTDVGVDNASHTARLAAPAGNAECQLRWGCSLFATLGGEQDRLYGRNFDWRFSPALLLFTNPPGGYASVSMVDMEYLGFEGDRSRHLMDLSLEDRVGLLEAPFLPFDGMNAKGLAIGMAAVPEEEMPRDPQKSTIDHLQVMREILDHAATVDEAIEVFGSYNIDMGNVPLHYLIASAAGDSAVVEFYQGEMVVLRSATSWQLATNFLVASTGGHPQGQCPRYDLMSRRLADAEGELTFEDALDLLEDVSQEETQWSIVYDMTRGNLGVVMDRKYSATARRFSLMNR